jgi:ribonucleoside-diphosphate reductase alpha subunit
MEMEMENPEEKLYVVNRDGEREDVHYDRMIDHIKMLCAKEPPLHGVDEALLARKGIDQMIPGITTSQIDNLLAEEAACMARTSDDYVVLAGRMAIHNLHKDVAVLYNAKSSTDPALCPPEYDAATDILRYSHVVKRLYENHYSGHPAPLISHEIYAFFWEHEDHDEYEDEYGGTGVPYYELQDRIENAIVHSRDYDRYTYFGIMTMIRKYLNHSLETKQVLELPQHMLMTVALGIHGVENLKDAIQTYELMSEGYFTHATPTLLNAGRPANQLASCYLFTMGDDSLKAIFECARRCAMISQGGGGVGFNATILRARGSPIKRFNGVAHGVCHELLGVFNAIARYVDQGGGKRKGAFAVYLEPWHADIEEFINLRATSGNMEMKCNDLHFGLWNNDLFMERVMTDGKWSLFCPTDAPGLVDAYGDDFETLYLKYEAEGKARKTIRAIDLWNKILDKQQEVSEPYMMYKDAVNRKSNQKHIGTIRGSNLCTEIVEYTSADEIAVCMLMSFALPRYVVLAEEHEEIERMRREYGEEETEQICAIGDTGHYYDHIKLRKHVQVGVRNLNRVIDRMWYPDAAAERSNKRHRPIGIGVQGLADVFGRLEVSWDSSEASQLNHDIFRTIYFSALRGSMECAKTSGPYPTYKGSPASKGLFQPEMWKEERTHLVEKYREKYEGEDWRMFVDPTIDCETIQGTPLAEEIAEHGLRNSLLVAPMPTASTAQLLGNNECFEPFTSNMYTRRTNAGDFVVYNKHMVHSLKKRGLWDAKTRNAVFMANGSVQHIDWIPDDMKAVFRTVWEIKQSLLIRMAAQRAPYVDQSMSLNLHVSTPSRATLNTLHFMSWKKKLKTGSYYIRREAGTSATSFNSVSLRAADSATSGRNGNGKREHEESYGDDDDGIPEASESSEEAKRARIAGACPLNSAVGEGDPSACEACSG